MRVGDQAGVARILRQGGEAELTLALPVGEGHQGVPGQLSFSEELPP